LVAFVFILKKGKLLKLVAGKNDYWWWAKRKGWVPVKQMNDKHLVNALNSMVKHGKSYTKGYYVLLEEIQHRGIDTQPQFTTC
jgi:hypothetical protein